VEAPAEAPAVPSAPVPAPAPAAATHAPSPEKPALSKTKPPSRLKTKIAGKRKLASTLPASSAFGEEDEEEVQVERRLIPIEYTPEELAAAAQPASTMAEEERREAIREGEAAAAKAQAAAAAAAKAAAKAAAAVTAKRLKGSVDWTAYVTEDAVARNVTSWVREKVKALLGEDEPSLVEFVGDALASKPAAAAALVADLEPMLGDETGPFVDELWRVLARETNK
jgi:RNA-binding protein 25